MAKPWKELRRMLSYQDIATPEFRLGDFMLPWGMIISTAGFLASWFVLCILERLGLTRHIWHLPVVFVALAVFFGCVIGLLLAP